MQSTLNLAHAVSTALAAGNAVELATAVLTISHRGRLNRLFRLFAVRFLEAHATLQGHPHSRSALKRALRAKAMLDLIRRRKGALGCVRASDAALLKFADDCDLPRLVHSRKAA